ncbi:MAG: transglutaminase family protein [Hyphomicrobiaceae bacterium]|nr:transglutaminase family protein [Hyphomicrobiaceae bacterium]
MRIKIKHETSYAYAKPATSTLQLLRMTPRSSACQFVRRWRVEVDVDARLDRSEDAFGNITHMIFAQGPIENLQIVVEGDVHTHDTGGLVKGTVERIPASFFLRDTPLTRASAELKQFARDQLAAEGGDRLATLHAINNAIFDDMKFCTESTTAATTAAESFAHRAGVCQDYAHIMIAAARTLGAPARYVSGYYMRTDTDTQDAGHAWAEAHVDGLGWIGFDPAHGMCVTDQYVRVAIGADHNEAAPVRGSQIGGQDEKLDVSIVMQQGQQIIES